MPTILVVDDRPVNIQFLTDLMGYSGYETLTAMDGVQALEMVREKHPDLVITDILMPNMNGYEFTEQLRADVKITHIPVVFYSATYKIGEANKLAEACGADAVLAKPTDPEVILETVEKLLGLTGGLAEHKKHDHVTKVSAPLVSLLSQYEEKSEGETSDVVGFNPDSKVPEKMNALLAINGQLASILDLFLELSVIEDAENIQKMIFNAAGRMVPSTYSAFSVTGQNSTSPRLMVQGIPESLVSIHENDRQGLIGRLSEYGGAYLIKNDVQMADLPVGHPPANSFLGVSVKSQQGSVGWLYFANDEKGREFTEVDARMAETLLTGGLALYENKELHELVRSHSMQLQMEMSNRKKVVKDLVEASRIAGKAEAATEVLHNVGNILNSVNVSADLAADIVESVGVSGMVKAVTLMREHEKDLGGYLSADSKGKMLLGYLENLSQDFLGKQSTVRLELRGIRENLDHMKKVVALQQDFTKTTSFPESITVNALIDISLRINEDALKRHAVQVSCDLPEFEPIVVDKHRVVQILVNLITNAKDACDASGNEDKKLSITMIPGKECIEVSVTDNGIGIAAENMPKMFTHGFTTRKEGHGFGLHSCQRAAHQLGGKLTATSDGLNKGATFKLELPLNPPLVNPVDDSQEM